MKGKAFNALIGWLSIGWLCRLTSLMKRRIAYSTLPGLGVSMGGGHIRGMMGGLEIVAGLARWR